MADNRRPSLGAALLGKTREAVIGLLFTQPDKALHVREIARRTGFAAPTVARELRLLEEAGVLTSETAGRQLEYLANPACRLFPELKSLAAKTWGIRGRIAGVLAGLPGIDCAFVFGSFASGESHAGSDVDVIVIGSVELAVLADVASRVTSEVGRAVNPKLYRSVEWSRKLGEGNHFVQSVAAGPKLFVVGDERVLDAIAEPRTARREKAAEPTSTYAKGGRKPPPGRARVPAGLKAKRRS